MKTEQERAWAGEFGNAYNRRSPGDEIANHALFERALDPLGGTHWAAHRISSIVELGAGSGANLVALAELLPEAELEAVEINAEACQRIATRCPRAHIHCGSLLDWQPAREYDLAFTKGVLIHIQPDLLGMAYETLHRASGRWILLAEYYNPTPVAVLYRGEEDRLWKRDFAGEMLDRYPDLQLVDYGFVYHRDRQPQDDITWFLMEKKTP